MRTTKTVWVYPPRDHYRGACLQEEEYLGFVRELHDRGFEIALHSVGSGAFSREEIKVGIEQFCDLLGFYPSMQINHAGNPDNLYWGYKRFIPPLSWLMRWRGNVSFGDEEGSEYFWGDHAKRYIKYIRNLVFMDLNTLRHDPLMPYRVRGKEKYSNYWFSASDGHSVKEFIHLIAREAVDRLEQEGGCGIVYTHLGDGFADSEGNVHTEFIERMRYLASKEGWFVPASQILDYLLSWHGDDKWVSYPYLLRTNVAWLAHRIRKFVLFGR
ncbi:MAG: hypothetical protein QXI20_11875 [Candidatus Jordarchaeales archaeon]